MLEFKYPYTDTSVLNLDWFLEQFKALKEEWQATGEAWSQMQQNFQTLEGTVQTFTTFVENYFENLDVQQEINNKLDQMALDGTLSTLLAPLVDNKLPDVVDTKLPGVVADQLSNEVAQQLPAEVAAQIDDAVAPGIPDAVTDWLDENVDPVGSAIMIDTTLTIAGAAADAKVVGDEIKGLRPSSNEHENNIRRLDLEINGYSDDYAAYSVPTIIGSDGNVKNIEDIPTMMGFYEIRGLDHVNQIELILNTVVSGEIIHYFNQYDGDDMLLSYATVSSVSPGSDVHVPITLQAGCSYIRISIWASNVSWRIPIVENTNLVQTIENIDTRLIANENKTSSLNVQINGGTQTFIPVSVNTMIGSDGTEKTAIPGTIEFWQINDLADISKITFTFATVISGYITHWFNQIDAEDNVLSYTPFYPSVGNDQSVNVNLLPDCDHVKVSVWNSDGAWSCSNVSVSDVCLKSDNTFSKVSGLGDSITAGYSSPDPVDVTYQMMIAEALGADYQNLGIASTPVCPNSDYTGDQNDNAFVYRYGDIAADADLIIIAGGTNDFRHNVPLGNESDTDSQFEQTFYGACDYLLKNIIANHVKAKIVWISPFHQNGDAIPNSQGHYLTDYLEAIRKKCQKYGTPYIDGYSNSGINMSTAFTAAMMPDYIHPNQDGHILIFRNLMPYFAMF